MNIEQVSNRLKARDSYNTKYTPIPQVVVDQGIYFWGEGKLKKK